LGSFLSLWNQRIKNISKVNLLKKLKKVGGASNGPDHGGKVALTPWLMPPQAAV
jgi:hypothetical protein